MNKPFRGPSFSIGINGCAPVVELILHLLVPFSRFLHIALAHMLLYYVQTFLTRNIFLSIWDAPEQLILFIRVLRIYIVYTYTFIYVQCTLRIYVYPCSPGTLFIPAVYRTSVLIYIYNKDEDEAEGKSNFFAPIKTLSPALFGGAHPLSQRYRMILLP